MTSKHIESPWMWPIAAVVLIVAVIAIAYAFQNGTRGDGDISNFQECKAAGGRIAESYPEQCFIGDKSFVNDEQAIDPEADDDADEYIGLSEQAAFDKATSQDKPHRVVEREGESLPVTMDYVPGRLNFYIRDGKVERVVVEGVEE